MRLAGKRQDQGKTFRSSRLKLADRKKGIRADSTGGKQLGRARAKRKKVSLCPENQKKKIRLGNKILFGHYVSDGKERRKRSKTKAGRGRAEPLLQCSTDKKEKLKRNTRTARRGGRNHLGEQQICRVEPL